MIDHPCDSATAERRWLRRTTLVHTRWLRSELIQQLDHGEEWHVVDATRSILQPADRAGNNSATVTFSGDDGVFMLVMHHQRTSPSSMSALSLNISPSVPVVSPSLERKYQGKITFEISSKRPQRAPSK